MEAIIYTISQHKGIFIAVAIAAMVAFGFSGVKSVKDNHIKTDKTIEAINAINN